MTDASTADQWYYEQDGQRKGPVADAEIVRLIKSSVITPDSSLWKQGLPEWLSATDTAFRVHFDHSAPPPLRGDRVNNSFAWALAFAPIVGYLLEAFVSGLVNANDPFAAQAALANGNFWFITIGLNIGLALTDAKRLSAAGHDTAKFKGWFWLVPVYLYQRAKATHQSLAYFITWVVCFLLVLFS